VCLLFLPARRPLKGVLTEHLRPLHAARAVWRAVGATYWTFALVSDFPAGKHEGRQSPSRKAPCADQESLHLSINSK